MNKIFQFGLGRTGSTLIYRIIKEIYPTVIKCHLPEIKPNLDSNCKIVVSIRHPIESFLSYIRVIEFPNSNNNISFSNDLLSKYLRQRINEEKQLKDILNNYSSKILVLKYEKFYNNFDYILNHLEEFLGIHTDDTEREKIINKCSIENSIKIQNSMSSFHSYDKDSHIHGRHISTPTPKESYKFINDEQLQFLESNLKDAISFWSKY